MKEALLMNSSMYGKIEKAIRYQQEPGRIHFQDAQIEFKGNHDNYTVSLHGSHWKCSCHSFDSLGTCSHVMAIQRILDQMLDADARTQYSELLEPAGVN
jgi:hypothetical protein